MTTELTLQQMMEQYPEAYAALTADGGIDTGEDGHRFYLDEHGVLCFECDSGGDLSNPVFHWENGEWKE